MKSKFNAVAVNIPVAVGWAVDKIHYTDGDPVVQLECSHTGQGKISVGMDIDKAEFTTSFPQPFTRNPTEGLAQKVRAAIRAPKP